MPAATGDVRSDLQAITTGARLAIKPVGTEEWVIHNVYHEADIELHFTDGTTDILFDIETVAGDIDNRQFHVNATRWIEVKNTNAGTKKIGYDGVLTHT